MIYPVTKARRVYFSAVKPLDFVVVVFAFLFVDLFDTLGTLIGVATKANMLDEEGRLPGIKPALIMVGFLMVSSVTEICFDDDNLTECIPAYIAIIAMPLFHSISEGVSLGIISYVVLIVCTGKAKKVKPLMYVLSVLFILKYIFL